MREVSVHDDDKVAGHEVEAVHVCCAETEFARSWLQDDVVFAEGALQLFGALEGAVGRGIVDDYDLPVEVPRLSVVSAQGKTVNLLAGEDIVQHLHEHRQVLALIVGWEDDRVLVTGRLAFGHGCDSEGVTRVRTLDRWEGML